MPPPCSGREPPSEPGGDNAAMHAPTVYLAGFDVFRPVAIAQGERLKACCAAQGWLGLYPLDNALPEGLQGLAGQGRRHAGLPG